VAADIHLEQYVQRKKARGRTYFYFRVVKDGVEFRRRLPGPFDAEYRHAYDAAHRECFGIGPDEFENEFSVRVMCRRYQGQGVQDGSPKYKRMSVASRTHADLAVNLVIERWGDFDAHDIRPMHAQALYDSLADRPATANRRMDAISAVFAWGRTRGFCDDNPCSRIERIKNEGAYDPWPSDALQKLVDEGKQEIVKVALVAAYTGQRRSDILLRLSDDRITNGVWYIKQGKTNTEVPVPLHPVVLAILEGERAARRDAGVVDPRRPLLTNQRGNNWTASGFGTSWTKELIRLNLRAETKAERSDDDAFWPTLHGLRHTNATLIANTVAKSPDLFGGIKRVKSMLGHMSEAMSRHYARMAETEHLNTETMLLIPEIGKLPEWIGKHATTKGSEK
jgi:integrase